MAQHNSGGKWSPPCLVLEQLNIHNGKNKPLPLVTPYMHIKNHCQIIINLDVKGKSISPQKTMLNTLHAFGLEKDFLRHQSTNAKGKNMTH